MYFWLLLLVPILFAAAAKLIWKRDITLFEFGIHLGVGVLVVGLLYAIALFSSLGDTNYVHGYVTEKKEVTVPCEHSYPCHCRTVCYGSGHGESCSTHCDTCYLHSHDYDWRVYSTVGWLNINRVDMQGVNEPPRYSQVVIGEPFTQAQSFVNYVKNSTNSLFHRYKNEKWVDYPQVYDYYRYNPIITDGVTITNLNQWVEKMRDLSAHQSKKTNVLLIFASASVDMNEYVEKVKGVWLGSKINDVVVVAGVKDNITDWVTAFTYGNDRDNEMLVVRLRDSLGGLKLDNTDLLDVLFKEVDRDYVQVNDKDFQYLSKEFELTKTQFIVLLIVILLLEIAATYFFVMNDEREYEQYNFNEWRNK